MVLGAATMRSLGVHIGDRVPVVAQSTTREFRVVGSAVFPRFAPYSGSEPTGLGIGAATTAHAIESMDAQVGSPFLVVQLQPHAHVSPTALTRAVGMDGIISDGTVVGPQRPNDVLSYDRLSLTPLLLACVLVLLALGSAIHLLVTGVRGRRRDVALLKTIGFTRGQARVSVLVQATVLVSLALVVAVPVGVLAGRWLWSVTAHWLGIAADSGIPLAVLALVVAVAIVTANLIALVPAVIAARIRPAVALRSE